MEKARWDKFGILWYWDTLIKLTRLKVREYASWGWLECWKWDILRNKYVFKMIRSFREDRKEQKDKERWFRCLVFVVPGQQKHLFIFIIFQAHKLWLGFSTCIIILFHTLFPQTYLPHFRVFNQPEMRLNSGIYRYLEPTHWWICCKIISCPFICAVCVCVCHTTKYANVF